MSSPLFISKKRMVNPSDKADLYIAEQFDAYFTMVPGSLIGNVFNALVLVWLFRRDVSIWVVPASLLLIGAMTFLRYSGMRRHRALGDMAVYNTTDIRKLQVQILGFSLVWGLMLTWLLVICDPARVSFIGMVAAGMMAAAAINLQTIRRGVQIYVVGVAVPLSLGLVALGTTLSMTSAVLTMAFGVILFHAGRINFNNFISRHQGEREAREASETVKLLLNDFEEHSSDWLWEIDEEGHVVNPAERFCDASGLLREALTGFALMNLFELCPEREILAEHIRMGRTFRDVTVPLMVGQERRWWSLSGSSFEGVNHLGYMRGVASDISATKNAEVKVAYMAHYDSLTDLPNRFLFNDTLNRALNRAKRNHHTVVMSLDLDHFKSVNDTLGHPAGDTLLKIVSRRIESCLKERDIVARMGGDEFAILLTCVRDQASVKRVAVRILEALSEPVMIEGNQIMTAGSIGIAMSPGDGVMPEDLMKNVDLALYSAKADGRNRYAFFEVEMDTLAQARRMVEIDLRGALSREELLLHYQPLINVESGITIGYEALCRWQHPTKGMVMPDEFVQIAEESGLIVQLGEWVIRNAIAEVALWPTYLSVAINLSPIQLKSGSLLGTVMNALASAQIDPARVEFEITESVLMHDSEANMSMLHRLRGLGVKIALDDFGTGYSSLNYLRSFPFDKIKIDRCFIEHVDQREDCQAIVRAVTGLANSLGMVTTAEGVETEAQMDQLRVEGCTQVQGFLFSPARPVGELSNLRAKEDQTRINEFGEITFLPAAALPTQVGRKRRAH